MNTYHPIAENDRIALLPYTHEDDGDMIACWRDAGTQRGYNNILDDDCRQFFAFDISQFPFWVMVRDQKTGCKVGALRLGLDEECPDLAIWIYPQYRSMGYGGESFRLSLKYLFEQRGYSELAAGCYMDNEKSLRILKRIGFERVPEKDEEEPNCFTGEPTRLLAFKIKAENFRS